MKVLFSLGLALIALNIIYFSQSPTSTMTDFIKTDGKTVAFVNHDNNSSLNSHKISFNNKDLTSAYKEIYKNFYHEGQNRS